MVPRAARDRGSSGQELTGSEGCGEEKRVIFEVPTHASPGQAAGGIGLQVRLKRDQSMAGMSLQSLDLRRNRGLILWQRHLDRGEQQAQDRGVDVQAVGDDPEAWARFVAAVKG